MNCVLKPSVRVFVFALGLALVAGCQRGDDRDLSGYAFHPVKGRVLVKNQPMTKGTITFFPLADPNFAAISEIQPDGTFELTSHMLGRTERGAPEGKYRVVVEPPPDSPGTIFTVKPGENDFTIKIGREPKQ
jgi:hypothetical protein